MKSMNLNRSFLVPPVASPISLDYIPCLIDKAITPAQHASCPSHRPLSLADFAHSHAANFFCFSPQLPCSLTFHPTSQCVTLHTYMHARTTLPIFYLPNLQIECTLTTLCVLCRLNLGRKREKVLRGRAAGGRVWLGSRRSLMGRGGRV
jgi:hypothetical protein